MESRARFTGSSTNFYEDLAYKLMISLRPRRPAAITHPNDRECYRPTHYPSLILLRERYEIALQAE